MTNNSREENGLANQRLSTADQGHGARSQGRRATSAWKPLETRPHHVSGAPGDSGAGASHRTVQAWMDSREKTARDGTPEPKKEVKSNHCDGTPEPKNEKSGPTAGRKRATTAGKSGPTSIANCRRTEGSQPSVKQTTNNHHSYRDPQTQITQQDGRDARQSSTEAPTVQTMLKDRKLSSRSSSRKPSRSLSQRRGRLDSEDRGDSSITVQ